MAVGATFFYAVNAFQIRTILREMDEEAVAFYNHGLSTLGFVTMAIACDHSTALPAMSMASDMVVDRGRGGDGGRLASAILCRGSGCPCGS